MCVCVCVCCPYLQGQAIVKPARRIQVNYSCNTGPRYLKYLTRLAGLLSAFAAVGWRLDGASLSCAAIVSRIGI